VVNRAALCITSIVELGTMSYEQWHSHVGMELYAWREGRGKENQKTMA
jgi:hypothetical protein